MFTRNGRRIRKVVPLKKLKVGDHILFYYCEVWEEWRPVNKICNSIHYKHKPYVDFDVIHIHVDYDCLVFDIYSKEKPIFEIA
jgi:hypothetical protein